MTGRALAHKVFQQYVGRTLSMAAVITGAVYFVGVTALTVVCAAVTALIALWWLYYLFYGPGRA